MISASAIYRGSVYHVRHAPREHRFRYRVYMVYLDLEEVEELFAKRWLWSYESFNVASFRRRDFLGDPAIPLREAVLAEVESQTGTRPRGAVRMLTQLRCLGLSFNPVTFYYCYGERDEAGVEALQAIVAEITNTPWNERHRYVLQATDGAEASDPIERSFDKDFHVSPFMSMDQSYVWRFSPPEQRLWVHMKNLERNGRMFDAVLELDRRPFTGRECAKALVRHPFITAKVVLGIYYQALRLKLKRVPFFSHPAAAGPEAS